MKAAKNDELKSLTASFSQGLKISIKILKPL